MIFLFIKIFLAALLASVGVWCARKNKGFLSFVKIFLAVVLVLGGAWCVIKWPFLMIAFTVVLMYLGGVWCALELYSEGFPGRRVWAALWPLAFVGVGCWVLAEEIPLAAEHWLERRKDKTK